MTMKCFFCKGPVPVKMGVEVAVLVSTGLVAAYSQPSFLCIPVVKNNWRLDSAGR